MTDPEWIDLAPWFLARLRWHTLCGVCGTPTGSRNYCPHCGAAICPRHCAKGCACRSVDAEPYDV